METKAKVKSKKAVFTIIFIFLAVVFVLFVAFADWLKIYELVGIYPRAENLTVAFIDVGQADAIYINTEQGNMLIDAGCSKDASKVREYLDRYRIKEIDTVIGTHDDWDHIGGMKTVVENYSVKNIYLPEYDEKDRSDIFATLNRSIKSTDTNVSFVSDGIKLIKSKDLDVRILTPVEFEEDNDSSLIVKLRYKDCSFLFMGDASSKTEEKLLENNVNVSADVLKVSHHGSRSATSKSFLKAVNPTAAVLSVGEMNTYNLPSLEVVKRLSKFGCKIYRTDLDGTVVMNSDGKNIKVQTEKIA